MSRGWIAAVALWATLVPAWSQAAPSAKLCRAVCVEQIASCIASGQPRAGCARLTLWRCRHEGLGVCQRAQVLEATRDPGGNFVPPDLLTAVARSSNEIDLSWTDSNAHDTGYAVERSTDPSGGFVVIAIVSQSPLSFRDASVADRTTYSYFVRAISRKGTYSPPSNILSATTPPAADTVAPTVPTLQHATAVSCAQVDLVWTASVDSGTSGLKGYDLYRDGLRVAQVLSPATSTSDAGLAPMTSYGYSVSAIDNAGNESLPSVPVMVTTPPCPTSTTVPPTTTTSTSTTTTTTPTASGGMAVRACLGKDSSATQYDRIVAAGFTALDRAAYRDYLDGLPAGVKALVWLGDYDNTTCTWEKSDDWIRTHVEAIAGHPAIAAYYIADEPHLWDCPLAAVHLKARSDFVKSLDPAHPTMAVIEPHWPENPYTPYVGTVDIIGVDRYPCSYVSGCVFSKIDDTLALLDQAGVPHYWAFIQAFADSYYRMPTADEVHEEFRHWRQSRMEGYVVFSWAYGIDTLENHPDLIDALGWENSQ